MHMYFLKTQTDQSPPQMVNQTLAHDCPGLPPAFLIFPAQSLILASFLIQQAFFCSLVTSFSSSPMTSSPVPQ